MSASTASPKKSPVVPAAAASPVAATHNSVPEAEAVNDANATRRSITGSLSWFGTKIVQTIERIGETVVDILGIDDSRFQDVLDGMTEEEMERAVAVNAQREREYREAGIITDDTLGQDDPDENEFQLPNLFTSRVTVSKTKNTSNNTTDIESGGGSDNTADNHYPIDIREIQSSGSVMVVDTKTVDSKQLLVPFPSPGGKKSPQKTQAKSPPNASHPSPSLEAATTTQVPTVSVSVVSPAVSESGEQTSDVTTLEAVPGKASEAAQTLSSAVESETVAVPPDVTEPAFAIESVPLVASHPQSTDSGVTNTPPPPVQVSATDCVTTVPPRPSSPEKMMKVESPSASKAMKANRSSSSPPPPPNPFAAAGKQG